MEAEITALFPNVKDNLHLLLKTFSYYSNICDFLRKLRQHHETKSNETENHEIRDGV
jgi:hypothetical protein